MEGVIILNTIIEEIHIGSLIGPLCIFGFILIAAGTIIITLNLIDRPDTSIIYGIVGIVFGIIFIITGYPNYGPVIDYNYSYEVAVEENVDFKEFSKQYEIIRQRGNIYTIKERNTD